MGDILGNDTLQGRVKLDKLAVWAYNNSGSDFTAGTLVCVNSWDQTLRAQKIVKADADVAGRRCPSGVCVGTIKTGNTGLIRRAAYVDGLDTTVGGGAVGDVVYLDAATAGGWTVTQPTGTTADGVPVGRIAVVSATVGAIYFDFASHGERRYGSNSISPASIGTALLDPTLIQYVEVVLTPAQVNASNGAPVTVVTAPGVGKALEMVSSVWIHDWVQNFATNTTFALQEETSGTVLSTTNSTILAPGADKIATCKAISTDVVITENKGIQFKVLVGASTAGVGSVVRGKIAYRVHPTGL